MGPDLHVLDPCHGWYLENAPPPALKHKPPEGGFFYFDGFTGHASALRQRHGHRPLARRLHSALPSFHLGLPAPGVLLCRLGVLSEGGLGSSSDALRKAGKVATHADRKSTRLNSSHLVISYAVFCLKKKKKTHMTRHLTRT